MNEDLSTAAAVLGKRVEYPQHYCPNVLVAVPRQLNRQKYNINPQPLPFVGLDAWHAYEISCLTNNGLPVVGLLKMVVDAQSTAIVESKSLKLYLNSLNMEHLGNTPEQCATELERRIREDVGRKIDANIQAHVFLHDPQAIDISTPYQILENQTFAQRLSFDNYTENPDILTTKHESGELVIGTHLLRSNCKITKQPDWGSVYIRMVGRRLPDEASLLSYIVSLRGENHFHEEICEMIYHRLYVKFSPEELLVICEYTRRGGIDICPVRASHAALIPQALSSANTLTTRGLRR